VLDFEHWVPSSILLKEFCWFCTRIFIL